MRGDPPLAEIPLGRFAALNSNSYSPAGFSSLTNVAISLPNKSYTLSVTKPITGNR